VWLGSTPVPPQAYLRALAAVARDLADGKPMPQRVEIKPTKLAAERYVAADEGRLWGWVIFPPNFRAPALMNLARQQTWALKPALLAHSAD
jgi:dipeptidyl aminopeptidase/acylaminoacyl peptidase